MTTDILSSPIDVLEKKITWAFENPNGSVLEDLEKSVAKGLIAREIELDRRIAVPKGPSAGRDGAGKTPYMRLQLVYLEQLWSFIYGWLVIYEEAVQKRMLASEFRGAIEFNDVTVQRAEKLRRWGESLVEGYTSWPEELPTPSSKSDIEGFYAIKVNGIFIKAVAFLLHHEYAHLRQGHLNYSSLLPSKDEAVQATRRALEREADDFAFAQLVSSLDGDDQRRINAWALLSPPLAALMLIRTPERLFPITHPIAHQRIGEVLSRLNFQSDESSFYFAYLATIVLRETLWRLTGIPNTQQTFDTAQDALDAVSTDLDSLEVAIART